MNNLIPSHWENIEVIDENHSGKLLQYNLNGDGPEDHAYSVMVNGEYESKALVDCSGKKEAEALMEALNNAL